MSKKKKNIWILTQIGSLLSVPVYYYLIGPALFSATSTGHIALLCAALLCVACSTLAIISYKRLHGSQKALTTLGFIAGLFYGFYILVGNYFL